jgi:hypothetical protein
MLETRMMLGKCWIQLREGEGNSPEREVHFRKARNLEGYSISYAE